jgi:hypothetical protein
MLKFAAAVVALLACWSSARAQPTYLPQASIAAAQARSQALCAAQPNPCDGVNTIYWLHVQPLTDGTAALRLDPNTPYSATAAGLTPAEQSTVVSISVMGTKLPWIVSLATLEARLTTAQLNALNNSADPTIAADWAAIQAGQTVDLTSAQAIGLVNRAVTLGLLTQAKAQTVLAWIAVAAVPP